MTICWTVGLTPDSGREAEAIRQAAKWLAEGKLVAFPTETVYGLGADARNTAAVEAIFRAKGRPADNPLIVHIAERSQLDGLIDRLDETSRRLMDVFWPGPLTLVLPVRPGGVSPRVTAGLPTVAVRMPAHPVALRLLAACGCPVAAPSANRSGRPSPTSAAHVMTDLNGRIDGVLDAGPCGVGVESTVVEAEAGIVRVLRPGGVSVEQLRQAVPDARIIAESGGTDESEAADGGAGNGAVGREAAGGAAPESAIASASEFALAPAPVSVRESAPPKSPGMKYAHYAPRGRLTLVQGDSADVAAWIAADLAAAKRRGERTGVLTREERAGLYSADCVVACGSEGDPESVARELYAALRRFDEAGATYILAETVPESGIGRAVMNRLRKAADGRVVHV